MRVEPCQREDISCRQHRLPLCQAAGTGRHHRRGRVPVGLRLASIYLIIY